uniref:Ig-like domain-containing protein n=1 Tax=Compsopogon caeruleus TaxID=31354 RepID=A0A7S1TAF6_9RHOD|mmetsp:Transcript_13842/g.28378  ORF Transcript_13842/g.28378 Transcript_13842/m.28378 type:complete len:102 (+) Transcript_13842:161-466(+)
MECRVNHKVKKDLHADEDKVMDVRDCVQTTEIEPVGHPSTGDMRDIPREFSITWMKERTLLPSDDTSLSLPDVNMQLAVRNIAFPFQRYSMELGSYTCRTS